MAVISDSTKSFYLVLLIIFLIFIGFFAFDYFGIIKAEEIIPIFKRGSDYVSPDPSSPTELEKMEIAKALEKLGEEREELEKIRLSIEEDKSKIEEERLRIEETKEGIKTKEKEALRKKEIENSRKEKIKVLANKVANMPPEKAREMLTNWNDYDIIEVFEQMDRDAAEEGRASLTTYLITLFPPDRRSAITSKWIDSGNSKELPE
jgi:flagellar protein FlbB